MDDGSQLIVDGAWQKLGCCTQSLPRSHFSSTLQIQITSTRNSCMTFSLGTDIYSTLFIYSLINLSFIYSFP